MDLNAGWLTGAEGGRNPLEFDQNIAIPRCFDLYTLFAVTVFIFVFCSIEVKGLRSLHVRVCFTWTPFSRVESMEQVILIMMKGSLCMGLIPNIALFRLRFYPSQGVALD